MLYKNAIDLVGNTPVVAVNEHKKARLWAKLEGCNPTGSLKDRTASALVQKALSEYGTTRTLLDASSGSYACALAYYGRLAGIPVTVVVNSKISGDNLSFLKSQRAEIIEHGNVTGESREHCLQLIENEPDRWFFTDQLTNPLAPEVHQQTTAREIFSDLPNVKTIIASKGSGATLCGIIRYVAENEHSVKIFGSIGIPGDEKKVAGTYVEGPDFISPFIDEIAKSDLYSGDVSIWYQEAMTQCLELPVLVGPQGGGVYQAALRAIDEYDLTGDVLMIMGDTILKNVSRF